MRAGAAAVSRIRARRRREPRRPVYHALHALADRAAPGVRNIFLRAVAATRHETVQAKVEFGLQHHSQEAAFSGVPWDGIGAQILRGRLGDRMQRLIVAAGTAAQRFQPAGLHLRLGVRADDTDAPVAEPIRLHFDVSNPLAIRAALEQSAELVTAISTETRDAIREAIGRAIEEGRPPRVAARDIRDMIGLNDRQVVALENKRAAGASEAELARATREALNYRAEMIARTETLRASNLGQEALWDTAADVGLIDGATATREFVVTPDERLCPVCDALDGKTYALGEMIHTEFGDVDTPPIHPHCRCVMVLNA